jgi:hypothetical protein
MQRLAIIVPYRDRADHLQWFMSHVRSYFARDKVDRAIPYQVLVVEQETGLPFNRGALLNIGFQLAEPRCDYVCFHDVDYLPVWADYSAPDAPTPLVWFGAEIRPIAPGRSQHAVKHDLNHYYSGAVLVPNAQFRQVDGYANTYWGWGFEDIDLKRRFDRAGIRLARRRGTFQPLDHDNSGFKLDGTPSPISTVNQSLFDDRWAIGAEQVADGLSTLDYLVMQRQSLPDPKPERGAEWMKITVRLNARPSAEQVAAVEAGRLALAGASGTRTKSGKRR